MTDVYIFVVIDIRIGKVPFILLYNFTLHTYSFGGASAEKSDEKESEEKEEPNFKLSGKLTAETNSYKANCHYVTYVCTYM